jgi:uncharacterized protein (DUF305 family)
VTLASPPRPSSARRPILGRPLLIGASPLGRRRFIFGTLAMIIALLLGYAFGLLTPGLRTPGDSSPEAGFARDMQVHHGQAVEMAMSAYSRLTDPDLQNIAYDIATSQSVEIGIMRTWLVDWHLSPTGTNPQMRWMPDHGVGELNADGLMPGMATDTQLAPLRAASGTKLDILFCQLMLRHHLGGIHMIDGLLQLTHDKQVRDVAIAMKQAQQYEVDQFTSKLRALHASPLTS